MSDERPMDRSPSGLHPMWDGAAEVWVEVPVSGGENVMVPVIRAIVTRFGSPDEILLQRRDDVDSVRGLLEIPGGRWGAGESPIDAVVREVYEETGVEVRSVDGVSVHQIDAMRATATVAPLTIAVGLEGAFPAVHVVLAAVGRGTPRPEPGETSDVRWWRAEDVRTAMEAEPDSFIPTTLAALRVYFGLE